MTYHVTWEFDSDRDDPFEAAEDAWETMRNVHSTANVFTVVPRDDRASIHEVDLDNGEMTTRPAPSVRVYTVQTNDYDGLYLFADEAQRDEFAGRYDDPTIGEQVLMSHRAGAHFLATTRNEDA